MSKTQTAFEIVTQTLAAIFAETDAVVLAKSLVWGNERREALKAWKATDEARALNRRDTWKWHGIAFAMCGGKSWYQVFNGNSEAGVAEFITKNHAAKIEKRNALIARKLEGLIVTKTEKAEYTNTRDGFNGTFVFETSAGKKYVNIQTIYAGGYNIQCLHYRTLVKVK